MMTEDRILKWMRQRIDAGRYDTAASLAREFLDEHNIHDVLSPDFMRVMDVGFRLAPEIAKKTDNN